MHRIVVIDGYNVILRTPEWMRLFKASKQQVASAHRPIEHTAQVDGE